MTSPAQDRLARVFRGVFSAVLALEALTLLLVPRAAAQVGSGISATTLTVTLALAGLLFVLAGLQRRSWAFTAGSVAQVALIGTGFIVTAMFFLGVIFAVIWVYAVRLQGDLHGRAAGGPDGAA